VRDPRAYVQSWLKYNPQDNLEVAALDWKRYHERTRRFAGKGRYYLLVYEKLIQDVNAEMAKLMTFIGVNPEPLLTAPKDPKKHHLMGNKMLSRFDGTIRHDESWREILSASEQEHIRRLTEPLFTEFGYRP